MILHIDTVRTYDGRTNSQYRCTIKSSRRLWGMPPSWKGGEDYYKQCHADSDRRMQEAVKTLCGVGGQEEYLRTPNPDKGEDGLFTYIFEYTIYTE